MRIMIQQQYLIQHNQTTLTDGILIGYLNRFSSDKIEMIVTFNQIKYYTLIYLKE